MRPAGACALKSLAAAPADVVHEEAVIKPRLAGLRGFECGQHRVHPTVAIDMHMHLPAGFPESLHTCGQHLGRHQPLAVVTIHVAGRIHLHQLREHGAIGKQLGGLAEPDLVPGALEQLLHGLQASGEVNRLVGRPVALARGAV